MKNCTKCKKDKNLNMFYKTTNIKDGFRSECKQCSKEACKNTRTFSKSIKIKYKKCEFCNTNLGVTIRINSNSCNSEQCKREVRKKYAKSNPDKMCAISAKRNASKLNATPKWLTEEHFKEIEKFYKQSLELSKDNHTPYQVDHIVPLQGKTVSGLHVPWNLQVITKKQNLEKGNRYE